MLAAPVWYFQITSGLSTIKCKKTQNLSWELRVQFTTWQRYMILKMCWNATSWAHWCSKTTHAMSCRCHFSFAELDYLLKLASQAQRCWGYNKFHFTTHNCDIHSQNCNIWQLCKPTPNHPPTNVGAPRTN